jgi:hypothetical protein
MALQDQTTWSEVMNSHATVYEGGLRSILTSTDDIRDCLAVAHT